VLLTLHGPVSADQEGRQVTGERIMNTWKRFVIALLALLALGVVPAGAALAQVKVTAATPSSAYQGTYSLDVVVSGSGFNNSAKVQYFVSGTTNPGGITVKKVTFRSSSELVTTIDVADTANLASFDIVVTLDSGRKGKGTTLFSVKVKPNEEPVLTYPPARVMQSFTSNGGTTAATSRLYMFGGDDANFTAIADLWAYSNAGSTGAHWTYIPGGSIAAGTAPSWRKGAGMSCNGGLCVLVGGMSTKMYGDTWIFNESTQAWNQVTCGRRAVCPPARAFQAMAYDPVRGLHVIFGGYAGTNSDVFWLADTYTFNTATKTWTNMTGSTAPPAREGAAASYVPGVGIVLYGGSTSQTVFNDMYVWSGTQWLPVTSTIAGDPTASVPSLYLPNMSWDPVRHVVIVAKGLRNTGWTPSEDTWFVTLVNSGGAWHAAWALASGIGCQSAASSPPDPVVHRGARMAFDPIAGVQVFFGGTSTNPFTVHGNTVECR
jgi:hypothetical protein